MHQRELHIWVSWNEFQWKSFYSHETQLCRQPENFNASSNWVFDYDGYFEGVSMCTELSACFIESFVEYFNSDKHFSSITYFFHFWQLLQVLQVWKYQHPYDVLLIEVSPIIFFIHCHINCKSIFSKLNNILEMCIEWGKSLLQKEIQKFPNLERIVDLRLDYRLDRSTCLAFQGSKFETPHYCNKVVVVGVAIFRAEESGAPSVQAYQIPVFFFGYSQYFLH